MACDCLKMKNIEEFFELVKSRDIKLITKMVRCVLNAKKKRLKKVDMFDVTFSDRSSLLFAISEDQYNELLTRCIKDLEKVEEYELCARIVKALNNVSKKSKRKKVINEKQEKSLLQ
jgi:hypothetical protein